MGNPLFPGSAAPGLRGGSLALSGSKSSKSSNEYDPSSHPGILNLGNTCFLNSVLQAIGNTKDFQLLIQGPSHDDPVDADGLSSYARVRSWPDRLQSPALRVSDEEHGQPRVHSNNDSSLAATSSSVVDPLATVKTDSVPLPIQVSSPPQYEPNVSDLPLNTAFRHVLEKIWDESRRTRSSHINPKRLLNLLGKKYDQYLQYGQQDGHELMRHLLDACRMEEVDMIKKMQPPKTINSKSTSRPTASLQPTGVETGDSAPTIDTAVEDEERLVPFLDLLFCGKLASMVVCEGCRKVSHTYEDFYDLSLGLGDDASTNKARKRDRLRSMADRWRRVTQTKPVVDQNKIASSASVTSSAHDTPIGTPAFSETEGSDADTGALRSRKSAGFLSTDEGRGRFQLRKKSIRRQPEALPATSGSEMEPDFPDMASLSLATVSHKSRPYDQDATPSASEDNNDGRTNLRIPRMLNTAPAGSVNSSRDPSPNSPISGRGFAALAKTPIRTKPASHQAAYIARILSDDYATTRALRTPGPASSPMSESASTAASLSGKPLHDLLRRGASAATRLPSSDFETNPNSPGAKRRRKIQEEQVSTGLIASLSQFTGVEVLDGENSFACKNCWRLANPPTVRERNELRRRRRRRGNQHIDDDEEDPSESSGLDSEGEHFIPLQKTRTSADDDEGFSSTTDSQSVMANSSVESEAFTSSSAQSSPQAEMPILTMTQVDNSVIDNAQPVEHVGIVTPAAVTSPPATMGSDPKQIHQKKGSGSSLNSKGGSPEAQTGYDTGVETDASGVHTGFEESATSGGETAGSDTEERIREKAAGIKRSAQSLPRRALKRYLIASAPPVLIFHLKRFQATGRGFVSGLAGFKKIDDQVTFPEYVDITPWLAPPREEYDRRGRLKATSDPLAIRKRAEEEAQRAGMDARDVQVEVQGRHGWHVKSRLGHHHGGNGQAGRKHAKWSWHIREPLVGKAQPAVPDSSQPSSSTAAATGDLEEGPKVKLAGGSEIIPSVIQRPKTEYRLYAVIVHQGSLSAGHYTAYILSDRIKLKDARKELIARSAPTSRTTTPAPHSAMSPTTSSQLGHRESLNFSQYFLGGTKDTTQKPVQTTASPAPDPTPTTPAAAAVPARPASARPASVAPPSMTMSSAANTLLSSSASSTESNNEVGPHTSNSSLETDRSKTSSISFSEGPKIVRPKPQLKRTTSWNSLDELDRPAGSAAPTMGPPQPSTARATVNTSRVHTHAKPEPEHDEDSIDKRKVDDGRRWVYTSDTIVRAATIDEVLKAKAYMLFYERV